MIRQGLATTAITTGWAFASSPVRAHPGGFLHNIADGLADPVNAAVIGSVIVVIVFLPWCRKIWNRVFSRE